MSKLTSVKAFLRNAWITELQRITKPAWIFFCPTLPATADHKPHSFNQFSACNISRACQQKATNLWQSSCWNIVEIHLSQELKPAWVSRTWSIALALPLHRNIPSINSSQDLANVHERLQPLEFEAKRDLHLALHETAHFLRLQFDFWPPNNAILRPPA